MERISTPWTQTPNNASIGNRTWFAIGDIHGHDKLLETMLNAVNTLGDGNHGLIFLGDLIDRGPNSLRCLELAENAKTLSGAKDVIKLPGNHELMMLDLMHGRDEALIWLHNGGEEMLESIEHLTGPLRSYGDLRSGLAKVIPSYWAKEEFPNFFEVEDFLFVHAGISPTQNTEKFLAQSAKKSRLQAMDREHWAWTRWSFLQHNGPWPEAPHRIVVHGHTQAFTKPILSPQEMEQEALFPDSFNRICLDGGAAVLPQGLLGEFKNNSVRMHAIRDTPGWLP